MFSNALVKIYATKIPDVLFHYTSSAGLLGILTSGKIWATKIHYLNDNSELQLAFSQIRREINRRKKGPDADTELYDDFIEALTSSETTNVSVASFTEMGDQLSQWRGYCQIGQGYALGFDGPKLKQAFLNQKNGYDLAPCVYETNLHRSLVKELLDSPMESSTERSVKMQRVFHLSTKALAIAPLIKAEGFKEEKEWRLITPILSFDDAKFRQGTHSLIPYWEVNLDVTNTLRSIVIGPTPEPILSMRALMGLLIKMETSLFQKVRIIQSKIPFRKI